MNTSFITNKTSSPLERKKTPAPVLDSPENSVEEKRVGWFDQNEFRGFDATAGSIDFNPSRVVTSSVVSKIFGGNDEWISITPVVDNIANAASKTINLASNLAPDIKDAGIDLFNQVTGKTEVPPAFQKAFEGEDPSKLDPTVAKKQKEAQAFSANEQQKESTEAEITNIRRKLDNLAQLAPLQQEVADLTGLQAMLSGKASLVNEAGETRMDLQASVAQKRQEILISQQTAKSSISSASKQGGQGANLDQNKINEGGSALSNLKPQ